MSAGLVERDVAATSDRSARDARLRWWLTYLCAVVVGLGVAGVAYKRSAQLYLGVCLAVLLLLWAAWARFPKAALTATVFLALVGDQITVSWFPFIKNLSSPESIFYVADSVSVSPLELTLLWALLVTGYRQLVESRRLVRGGALGRPLAVYVACCALGLAVGLGAGGDVRVAIFEVRPFLLLPIAYVVVTNVCRTRADYGHLLVAALVAVVVQSLLSLRYLDRLDPEERAGLETLTEHGAAIGMNLLFVVTVMTLLARGAPFAARAALCLACLPVLWVYLVAERRAAVVALGGGLALVALQLLWHRRAVFWRVVPAVALATIAYTGAFWNSTSTAGFPAQAIKSVVAPDQLDAVNQSSDLYREIEKYDLSATIRSAPVLGRGFGQVFLRPVPLPDISAFFEFDEYIPHNSLLYVWIKLGFVGFVAFLYLLARTMALGAARIRAGSTTRDDVTTTAFVAFALMFAVYLYVEIAWEPRNVVLLAIAMGVATGRLDDDPTAPPEQPVEGARRGLRLVGPGTERRARVPADR